MRARSAAIAGVVLATLVAVPASAQAPQSVVKHAAYHSEDPAHPAEVGCVAAGVGAGSSQTVFVTSYAVVPGAVAVRASCAIVQAGRVVRSFQNALPGPLGASAGTMTLPMAPWSICVDVYVLFVDGAEVSGRACSS